MKKHFYLCVYILLFSFSIAAQDSLVDSLKQLLDNTLQDTNRVKILNELAYELTQETDHNLALPFVRDAAKLAEKLNYLPGTIAATFNEGLIYYYNGQYERAAANFERSAKLNESIEDWEAAASSWNSLGNTYNKLNDSVAALNALARALDLRQKIGKPEAIGSTLMTLGVTHYYESDFQKALEYYQQALPYFEKDNYQRGISVVWNNIGLVHKKRGRLPLAIDAIQKSAILDEEIGNKRGAASSFNKIANIYDDLNDYESAIKYHEKSLALKRSINYKVGISSSLTNLANIYQQIGNYQKAEQLQRQAIAIKKGINRPSSLSISYRSLGQVFFLKDQLDSANHYYQQAWMLHQKNLDLAGRDRVISFLTELFAKAPQYQQYYQLSIADLEAAHNQAVSNQDLASLQHILPTLSASYEQKGQFQKALKYQKKIQALQDTIFTQEKYVAVAEIREQYETAEKEKQLAQQALMINQQGRVSLMQYGLIFILFWILLFLFVFYRQRQTILQQRLHAVQEREQVIQLNAMMSGQEVERKRMAKDLHDGLGGLLSTVKLKLHAIAEQVDQLSTVPIYVKTFSLVETACEEVRRIAHNMMPGALNELGLIEAVQDLVDNINHSSALNISLQIMGTPLSFSEEKNIMLYRIVQELLHNILKHAEAENAWVQFSFHEQGFGLFVEDDGCGFNADLQTPGLGLRNIQSRAKFLGALFSVDSTPGEGSVFSLEMGGQ